MRGGDVPRQMARVRARECGEFEKFPTMLQETRGKMLGAKMLSEDRRCFQR
jgi:hypothetical protein